MSKLVSMEQIESVLNIHFATQRQNPPDSPEAISAAEANRALFQYCDDMGWKYITIPGGIKLVE